MRGLRRYAQAAGNLADSAGRVWRLLMLLLLLLLPDSTGGWLHLILAARHLRMHLAVHALQYDVRPSQLPRASLHAARGLPFLQPGQVLMSGSAATGRGAAVLRANPFSWRSLAHFLHKGSSPVGC